MQRNELSLSTEDRQRLDRLATATERADALNQAVDSLPDTWLSFPPPDGRLAPTALLFVALTLTIGQPFYEAISKNVEDRLGWVANEIDVSFGGWNWLSWYVAMILPR